MKYVIIGVGAAGMTAAKTIRECEPEAEICMISQDSYVHSRCMLHKFMSGERTEEELNFVEEDFFEHHRISWIKDVCVIEIDSSKKQVVLQDQLIAYDKLLIATGANSFMPPVGDFRTAHNVFGLRHLTDAQSICQSIEPHSKVLVVGSGLVGLDAAYALLERGLDVTVVEMAERILPMQLDETAGKAYQELFEKAGCKFYLERKASETVMDESGKIDTVILDDGTKIPCDIIIVAAGVRPAVLPIKGSVQQTERSIEVNAHMETTAADIYAAGDVTGRSGIWPNAQKQGQVAAYNMCGIKMQYLDTYAMKNTINFYGLATLSLGRGETQEGDVVEIREDSKQYKKAIIRGGKLDSIVLQGNMDYAGIYQYLIKNEIEIAGKEKNVFDLSFADFYGVQGDGQFVYRT